MENTKQKVQRRLDMLRGQLPLPKLSGCDTILVDDGLASGFTMLTAVTALRNVQAEQIVVAVPTAHQESLQRLIQQVDAIYCPNIRSGWRYAVADAYQYWSDVEEKDVKKILNEFHKARG
ncbi:phosphoribosyltransferase family protein [Candidatus Poribacteria bacterium]